jgi:ribosomal protein S18 acetylase RimI-like enzyme
MVTIRPLSAFDPQRFVAIAGGYTTAERYVVTRAESDAQTTIQLTLEPLAGPRDFRFPYSAEDLSRYTEMAAGPFALGAYDDGEWIGAALGEAQEWNKTLWVWEFHVAESHRCRGIGRRLMDAIADLARDAGLRALFLETQNTNVPAIRFYRAVGFTLDGINVAYYTNEDLRPDRTVAIFMIRRLV